MRNKADAEEMGDDLTTEYILTYADTGGQDRTDVSFELTEEAEEMLLNILSDMIYQDIRSWDVPSHKIHLFERLQVDHRSHEIRADDGTADVRVYDLAMSDRDYQLFTTIVGRAFCDTMFATQYNGTMDLVESWQQIYYQMLDDNICECNQTRFDDYGGAE